MDTSVTAIAERLRGLLAEALEIDAADVGNSAPLFEDGLPGDGLCLDSLEALSLLTAVADEFGLDPLWLDGRDEPPPPTLLELARLVQRELKRKGGPSHA